MGSTGDRAKGKANEMAGKVTGDRKQELKGKAQQAMGAAKQKLENAKAARRSDADGDDEES